MTIQEQVQIFYDIAMDIGGSHDMQMMLRKSIRTILRKSNGMGALVFADRCKNSRSAPEEIYRIVLVFRDVTREYQMREALKENQRQLHVFLNNFPGLAYRCKNDMQYTMQFVSKGCFDLTGYHDKELTDSSGITYADIIYEEDRDYVWQTIQKALKDSAVFQLTYRIRHKTGSLKWAWEQGQGFFDENHEVIALEGFISDISKQKQSEKILIESEAKFRTITEQMTDMVFLTDDQGIINYVSPVSDAIFGKSPEEMQNHHFREFIVEDDISKALEYFQTTVRNQDKTRNLELRMKHKDGFVFTGEVNGTFYMRGKHMGTIGIIRDVTRRKQIEHEKKSLIEDLEIMKWLRVL